MRRNIMRGGLGGWTRWAAAMAMVITAGGTAAGDIIFLTDGSYIRGKITKETADELEVDGTTGSGIPFVGKISRARVQSITKTDSDQPAPAPAKADKPEPGKKDAEPAKAKEAVGDFLVIPLKGTFGEEIVPKGVDTALDWAVQKGVKQAVFVIDSPGGYVWAAEEIRKVIKEHEGKVECHILIQKAISASIWVVFGSHKIGVLPGSTLGAAVAFHAAQTGNAEVDEKMNSAYAASIASEAERLGHSGELARAMVLTDLKLYAQKKEGAWKFVHDLPMEQGAEFETLADGHRVVTLTAEQMVKYGVATKVEKGDDSGIAGMLGDEKLKPCGSVGETSMKNAAERTKAVRKTIDGWAEQVLAAQALMQKAVKLDDVDKAIQAVDDYLRQLRRVGAIKNSAKDMGMLEYPALNKIDVATEVKETEDLLLRLKKLRTDRRQNGR